MHADGRLEVDLTREPMAVPVGVNNRQFAPAKRAVQDSCKQHDHCTALALYSTPLAGEAPRTHYGPRVPAIDIRKIPALPAKPILLGRNRLLIELVQF